jgi:hypothetical protein
VEALYQQPQAQDVEEQKSLLITPHIKRSSSFIPSK